MQAIYKTLNANLHLVLSIHFATYGLMSNGLTTVILNIGLVYYFNLLLTEPNYDNGIGNYSTYTDNILRYILSNTASHYNGHPWFTPFSTLTRNTYIPVYRSCIHICILYIDMYFLTLPTLSALKLFSRPIVFFF